MTAHEMSEQTMNRKPPTVVSSRRDAGGRTECTTDAAVGHKLPSAERRTLAQLPSQPRSASLANPQREDASVPLGRVGRSPGRPALSREGAEWADGFFLLLAISIVVAGLAVLLHLLGVGS